MPVRRSSRDAFPRARRAVAEARAGDAFLYAAALAFFGLVSVAPLVVVALWVTSVLVGEEHVREVGDDLARFAPPDLGVEVALERVADLGITGGLVAVAAALWPASAYGAALVRVFDRLDGEHSSSALRGRGATLLLIGLVPALVLGSLAAGYVGAAALGDTAVEIMIGMGLALASSFTATVATVGVIFKVLPRHPPSWPATVRGSVVAAGGIAALSVAYVAYLRLGANFGQRYASDALAAVVLLAAWLFASNIALLLGFRVARRADRELPAPSSAMPEEPTTVRPWRGRVPGPSVSTEPPPCTLPPKIAGTDEPDPPRQPRRPRATAGGTTRAARRG